MTKEKTTTEKVKVDSLLECLVFLASKRGRVVSQSTLVANLPLLDGCLSPELFVRAAPRAGVDAKIVERPIADIPSLVTPVVLLMEANRAVILSSISSGGQCRIVDPVSKKSHVCSVEALKEEYSGYAIFIKEHNAVENRIEADADALSVHWFWGALARSWRIYRDVLIASFMVNVFVLANPLFVMNVYDRVVPNNAIETLWALAIGVLIIFSFDFVLRLLRTYFIEVAGKKADILLSEFILEKVLGAHFSTHPKSVGAFSSRVREFETVRNFITSATVTTLIDLPFVLLFLVVVAYIGSSIVWVPVLAIPVILLYAWVIQKKLKLLVSNTFVASAQKNATLVEALTNLEALKSLGAESKVLRKWEAAVSTLALWGVRWRIFSVSATTFSAFIQQVSSVCVVIVGVYLISENELTQGALIACVILVGRALAPLAQVSGLLVQYHQSRMALDSLEEIVHAEQERPANKKFIEHGAFTGAIEFKHLSFTYPHEQHPCLHDVSFRIAAKEKVAVIGRMGSGKSTLHKLLVGLYHPSSGAVLMDGLDITQIDPAQLRANVGYVPQESTLFYGDIRENIAYRQTLVDDVEMRRVAKVAGVDDFVSLHPQGYGRVIGERGESLSGGQRQAINLARGLIGRPSIVLLDEPTTAMDNATEAKLLERLKQELEDRTALIVTHKTALLNLVDRIIVLEAGKVVADGPKEAVLTALQKGQIRAQ